MKTRDSDEALLYYTMYYHDFYLGLDGGGPEEISVVDCRPSDASVEIEIDL